MRGGGERQNGPSGKLWGGTCCGTQCRFPRIAFAHFQQAFAQIDPRQHIVRLQPERVPIEIGGGGIFPVQDHRLGERDEGIVSFRRERAHLLKHRARPGAVVPLEIEIAKRHPQIDAIWRKRETALEQFDAFVKTSGVGELATEFDECRRKGWTPRGRALQLLNGLAASSGGRQGHGKQGFSSGSPLRRAARCRTSIASSARFWAKSARPRMHAAGTLPRFDFNTCDATRSASSKRCICSARTAFSSARSTGLACSDVGSCRFDISLENKKRYENIGSADGVAHIASSRMPKEKITKRKSDKAKSGRLTNLTRAIGAKIEGIFHV